MQTKIFAPDYPRKIGESCIDFGRDVEEWR